MTVAKTFRCAIYTRKSSEEGLEQDFNSLHAQREACEAFIRSQKHEGWTELKAHYDDGGFSGGNMERPALKQLLADIKAKAVDVVVVYKIDRLTRSLMDFSHIVEVFDASSVSFVSVTQQFNTTTSMGRLTLNVLLSFAQFEREVTGERIRDKIRASKQKGMWMGGTTPLGYDVRDRKLVINPVEAEQVRWLFSQYALMGSARETLAEAVKRGIMGKTSGRPMAIGAFHFLLRNPIYIGKIRHKELVHPGQHEAILDEDVFTRVQAILDTHRRRTGSRGNKSRNMLVSMIEDEDGNPITPTHTVKNAKRYHYYVSNSMIKHGGDRKGWRIPAHDIETLVVREVRQLLEQPARLSSMVPASLVQMVLERTKQVAEEMAGEGRNILLRKLVKLVVVGENGVRIHIAPSYLCKNKDVPDQVIEVGVKLRHCGRDMRLVLADGMLAHGGAEVDPALVRVLERAEGWFDSIAFGDGRTAAELARREGVNPGYIKRLLPMAFLAPDIRDAIMEGKQPAELSAQRLTRMPSLPPAWDEQRRLLGFTN